MKVSFVIPAYNASATIGRTLRSLTATEAAGADLEVEIVVVDDGSKDSAALQSAICGVAGVRLLDHPRNRGMCAARNTGIGATTGDVVVILDADDEMVAGWRALLGKVISEWPPTSHVCFASCRNDSGRITVSRPDYSGAATFQDMLVERYAGEYLPMFRGPYVRSRLYTDLGTRKSCGLLSYLTFAAEAPLWISARVLRIYHDAQPDSVTSRWAKPDSAAETVRCYEAVLERFGAELRKLAPRQYRQRLLRIAVYKAFANSPGRWESWLEGTRPETLAHAVAAALLMLGGPRFASRLVAVAKRSGLVKAYG